jgi:predicted amidohydrolase YtcJ
LLITGVELPDGVPADVRLGGGRIEAIGCLAPGTGERVVDAGGGALLPGLHDHHLHLYALAAAAESIECGPPAVRSEADLAEALRARAASRPQWIRGVGFHESVTEALDRHRLDAFVPDVPVRIQHRSGRLWILNSAGFDALAAADPLLAAECPDGRLYDADVRLRAALGGVRPGLGTLSFELAAAGLTGVTDMTPENDAAALNHLSEAQRRGELRQRLLLAGRPELEPGGGTALAEIGPTKVHLHDSDLPAFDDLCGLIRGSHRRGRAVAFHCVTETELVFAIAALDEAGTQPGDRIEHASVTPDPLLERIRDLGLVVVTQPNFVAERGDAYLRDVPVGDQPLLYRARSFLAAGVGLAAGSDAPFGRADPWLAMRAAVTRRTRDGALLGAEEALTPEQALALFTGSASDPGTPRAVAVGAPADLVLLDRPWLAARKVLSREMVRLTLRAGEVIAGHDQLAMASTSPQARA